MDTDWRQLVLPVMLDKGPVAYILEFLKYSKCSMGMEMRACFLACRVSRCYLDIDVVEKSARRQYFEIHRGYGAKKVATLAGSREI